MAFTERYVTSAAGGGGDGQIGTPWTLAESFTNAVAGDRVNVQSDSGYSLGADVIDGEGTFDSLLCFRGYNSTIGDLENQGWNSIATLNTTNFPVITLSGSISFGGNVNNFVLLQNLSFTASSLSAYLLSDITTDKVYMVECSFLNSTNNTSAGCVQLDNFCYVLNCDMECSGAAHAAVLDIDINSTLVGSRFKGLDAGIAICQIRGGTVVGNLFQGTSGAGIGLLYFDVWVPPGVILNNTFYDCERALSFPNSAPADPPIIINNHATDSAEWINNLYSGTNNLAMIEINNRTRDNTTPRTGVGDGANIGEVTTDTGGDTTDYTNPGSNDFTLITGAPGVEAGMRQHTDIGAYQRLASIVGGAWMAASIMGRYIADIVRR